MKHFLDSDWLAPNVLRAPIDTAIPGSFADLVGSQPGPGYVTCSPPWQSDVRWIAAAAETSFLRFERAFHALGAAQLVEPYVSIDHQVRMYAAHVVVRSRCTAPDFHLDWEQTGNEAFTLLTPIIAPPSGFGLQFKTIGGEIRSYDYRAGEALIFGDHFVHATSPGETEQPVALLSFVFGTDRMEHWPRIARTAARQGGLLRRPDGVLIRSGEEAA